MYAERSDQATVVDLLDRILKKGLVIRADLIISVAGIPLIGLNLTAALAGISTMLEYGMWEEWDAAHRASAAEKLRIKRTYSCIDPSEVILLTGMASCSPAGVPDGVWRSGSLICTDKRLRIIRRVPEETLIDLDWSEIRNWHLTTMQGNNTERDAVSLDLKGSVVCLATGKLQPLCSLLTSRCGSHITIAG
ncbi:gas vesicle protein [Methanocalculus sp.]|uniref:gas vesicle protein n=1 Tax=Methanocalculus sp. TaxID=2004547 RepID=UPI002722B8C7|nr:gas vesicle protein [Methanocalculus sp.]MDO8841918.1 gas vesicle protein [Methanocalculus sp.]